jgi:hypothetical protein
MKQKIPTLHRLMILGIAVALAGSLYALLNEGCRVCSQSAELVGGLNLGAIGLGYYGLLLAAAAIGLVSAPSRLSAIGARGVMGGLLIAGGVHLTLVAMLLRNRVLCPPCLVTGAGALLGAAAVLVLNRRALIPSLVLVAAVSVAAYGGTRILRQYAATNYERVAFRAEQALLRERAVPSHGHALMVVYEWPTCHYCQAFKAQVLPPLRQEFRRELVVEERTAWMGMVTPTVILLGQRDSRLCGFQPLPRVRQAVRLACGAGDIRS